MFKLLNLEKDERKELSVIEIKELETITKKTPKKHDLNKKKKKRGRQRIHLRSKLKKKLNKLDSHHYQDAVSAIDSNMLHSRKLVSNVTEIATLCRGCNNCLRSLAYCMAFNIKAKGNISSCASYNPIK